ncbi:AMSH-like ubiquitin thioesterase 3 [Dichanthelium oligosanthes]|uniref:AMSH-like ubiquitin thioesterase 3 n=1 Tax=Dichanthelium oligosanthes TaxID=888268 RepID=A0A1E5W9F5_9POAL|nr:AMSH-like ubiquitin thioesterase 3 [Dichanthelium oligosanthes]
MGPPQPARGSAINIEACARPIAVDNRISLPYYFRIAGSLLRQANIYRNEQNFLDLYVILLRYSSLLCETIPKHRDYHAFRLREKAFFDKLNDVMKELESLKPVVQRQVAEHNRGGTVESNTNSQNGTYAAARRIDQHTPSLYTPQPFVGSANGALQKYFHVGRQVPSLPSVQPDRQIQKQFMNLPYPKEETLARHSILGPNGLHGRWNGPVTGIKVQYPSNFELTQSDMTSLVPSTLNQDGSHGPSTAPPDTSTNDNDDMKSVLSLDDGRWSVPAKEQPPLPSASLEEELFQLNIKQPSPPPVLAEVQRPISPSRVADPTPGLPTSGPVRFQNLHVKKRTFYVTTLIIPKQKSTSNTCEATNEEELFEVQDTGSLFTLGWIHRKYFLPHMFLLFFQTHPTQSCFLSSIDLHNHYSYQVMVADLISQYVMLPEAIAIVMAPTDTTRKHGIFHLTDPGGMGVIHDCQERGFHPHKAPLDGSPIYEQVSHVYMDTDIKFDMIDLRER